MGSFMLTIRKIRDDRIHKPLHQAVVRGNPTWEIVEGRRVQLPLVVTADRLAGKGREQFASALLTPRCS